MTMPAIRINFQMLRLGRTMAMIWMDGVDLLFLI